jgi:hypothetical protein
MTSLAGLFDEGWFATRRRILLAPLLAALPLGLSAGQADALNPSETQITPPDQIKWTAWPASWRRNGNALRRTG